MQGVVGGTVEVVELPCGGPQAALSYTAAIGRIARIPQWSGIRTASRPGQLEYPGGRGLPQQITSKWTLRASVVLE